VSVSHRCTDPHAIFTSYGDGWRVTTDDDDAMLVEFREGAGEKVPAVVIHLATGWARPVLDPLAAAALKHATRPDTVAAQSWLTEGDIARVYRLRRDPLRMRLQRYRHAHKMGDGYKEIQDGATLKVTYLYLLGAVSDITRKTPPA
jgi:hypothetical protein